MALAQPVSLMVRWSPSGSTQCQYLAVTKWPRGYLKHWTAALGKPVVPEVKNMSIRSSPAGASLVRMNSSEKRRNSLSKSCQPGRQPSTMIFTMPGNFSAASPAWRLTSPLEVHTTAVMPAAS